MIEFDYGASQHNSHFHVMKYSNMKQWRRAERVGATLENGRVAHHYDSVAVKEFSPKELKVIRGYGFEDAVFVIGERGLVSVKEQDPCQTTPVLKRGDGYVANMTGVTVKFYFSQDNEGVHG